MCPPDSYLPNNITAVSLAQCIKCKVNEFTFMRGAVGITSCISTRKPDWLLFVYMWMITLGIVLYIVYGLTMTNRRQLLMSDYITTINYLFLIFCVGFVGSIRFAPTVVNVSSAGNFIPAEIPYDSWLSLEAVICVLFFIHNSYPRDDYVNGNHYMQNMCFYIVLLVYVIRSFFKHQNIIITNGDMGANIIIKALYGYNLNGFLPWFVFLDILCMHQSLLAWMYG